MELYLCKYGIYKIKLFAVLTIIYIERFFMAHNGAKNLPIKSIDIVKVIFVSGIWRVSTFFWQIHYFVMKWV